MAETLSAPPGLVVDLYCMRVKYDDMQHGIKRKKAAEWSEE